MKLTEAEIRQQRQQELGEALAATFLENPNGKKVLRWLLKFFDPTRQRFKPRRQGEPEVHPSFIDGECSVVRQICDGISLARPGWDTPESLKD